ncbi:hemicentin-2-like [Branchiostoma floridae]|uniref:Hemicentin-2-like n=1 Tax=Branchiostoma floridae TaxID=7739 RepID=A0A9J7LMN3_BRAFL|nr:hemicentin-2-like [Branchiostoma floridae]
MAPSRALRLLVLSLVLKAHAAVYRTVPQSTAVLLGHDVTLNCSLSGLSEQDVVNWHWYNRASQAKHHHISAGSVVAPEFSRYSIVGDTEGGEFNLRIQNARLEDEGKYQCSAFSVQGATTMQLFVVVPPTVVRITGNLTPRVVGEGLVLSCRSEGGSPIPRLSWYNGTVRNPQSDHAFIMDAETSTVAVNLLIPSLTKWDNGANISCVSDQGFPGTVRPKAAWTSLVVYYPPVVTPDFPSARAAEGQSAQLSCHVNSSPVTHVTWARLTNGKPTDIAHSSDVLQLKNVSRTDAGLYECRADNGIKPSAAATVMLDVTYAPSISRTFDSEISVLYGQDVLRLECVADGNPKPRVWWRRNDTNGLYENPLTLSPMDYRAEGLYECVALSAGFIGARRRTFINVIGRPDVLGDTAAIFADEGEEVTLTCKVMSDPPCDAVQWVFRSHSGDEKRLHPGENDGVKVKTVLGDIREDVLTICKIDASYTGTYVCKATNVFGTDQRQFRVHIRCKLSLHPQVSSMLLIVTLCTSAAAATTVLIILAFCLHRLVNRLKRADAQANSRNCAGSETDKASSDLSTCPRLESSKGPARPLKQRTCSTLLSDNNVSCDELFFPWCAGHHPNHSRVSRQRQLESAMKAKYLAETRKVATRRPDDADMTQVFGAVQVEVTDKISRDPARPSPCKLPPDPGRTKENFETKSNLDSFLKKGGYCVDSEDDTRIPNDRCRKSGCRSRHCRLLLKEKVADDTNPERQVADCS